MYSWGQLGVNCTPAERHLGCCVADAFIDPITVAQNGFVVTGTLTIKDGVYSAGTTNYLTGKHLWFDGDFGVSFWAYPENLSSAIFVGNYDGGTNSWYILMTAEPKVKHRYWIGGAATSNLASGNLSNWADNWHCITLSVDRANNTRDLYIDDLTPISDASNLAGRLGTPNAITLMAHPAGTVGFYGALKRMKLFQRTISQADHDFWYAAGPD